MARSLGLAAYRVFSRRRSSPSPAHAQPGPEGEVLWLHATTKDRFATLGELGARVRSLRDDLVVLITAEQEVTPAPPVMQALADLGIQVEPFASDHPEDAQRFLDHWKPDICLWAGLALMPNLISLTGERAIPMVLIDVGREDFSGRKHKWFPDLTRSCLKHFEVVMASSQAAFDMLRRVGVARGRITVNEPLRNGPSPEPFSEDDLSDMAQQLGGRPLWLAAFAQVDEFELILAAHRSALKLIHRLALVLTVSDPKAQAELERYLGKAGLRFARWQMGDEIDDNTQVLISATPGDLGLWYRMAPLTLMASSLKAGHTGRNPLGAVALGSAILFGPHVLNHRDIYARLAGVGAARSIGDAQGLGAAVIRLVAPDHAAAMALAGWEVVTQGAELTDQLVELVLDRLDGKAVGDAAP